MPLLKDMTTTQNGYGRVDAFGVATQPAVRRATSRTAGRRTPPSASPHIWGIENTAWLQWGANMNSVMERNIGQSLGVGAVFDPELRDDVAARQPQQARAHSSTS